MKLDVSSAELISAAVTAIQFFKYHRGLASQICLRPEECARARSAPRVGALHTLAHSQHITYPVTDVSGLSCRAQLRSTRLVWQALEMCSTLCTTSDFT